MQCGIRQFVFVRMQSCTTRARLVLRIYPELPRVSCKAGSIPLKCMSVKAHVSLACTHVMYICRPRSKRLPMYIVSSSEMSQSICMEECVAHRTHFPHPAGIGLLPDPVTTWSLAFVGIPVNMILATAAGSNDMHEHICSAFDHRHTRRRSACCVFHALRSKGTKCVEGYMHWREAVALQMPPLQLQAYQWTGLQIHVSAPLLAIGVVFTKLVAVCTSVTCAVFCALAMSYPLHLRCRCVS